MDDALLSVGRVQTSILILLDFSINYEILPSCLMGGTSPGQCTKIILSHSWWNTLCDLWKSVICSMMLLSPVDVWSVLSTVLPRVCADPLSHRWHGLSCHKPAGETQLHLRVCVHTHTALTNLAVEEKQLVKGKQKRGKTGGSWGSIFKSLSFECTVPGTRAHFSQLVCLFHNLGVLLNLLLMPSFPIVDSKSNTSLPLSMTSSATLAGDDLVCAIHGHVTSQLDYSNLKYASTQHSCLENSVYCCSASLQWQRHIKPGIGPGSIFPWNS